MKPGNWNYATPPHLEEPLYDASRHLYLAETDEEAVDNSRP